MARESKRVCLSELFLGLMVIVLFALGSCSGEDPVDAPGPALKVQPTAIDFGTGDVEGTFNISNGGGGALTWSVSKVEPWIEQVTPLSGAGPETITVKVNRTGLSAGTKDGTVSVTSNGGDVDVGISMVVPDAVLAISTDELDFGESATQQAFTISNTGVGTLTWSLSDDASWVSLDQGSGTGPATVTVTVNRSNLEGGPHSAQITVTSSGGTKTIDVQVTATLLLSARFNSDPVNQPPIATLPGPPPGDGLTNNESAGEINVRFSVGDMRDHPVEGNQEAGLLGSIGTTFVSSGSGPCKTAKVSWRSLMQSTAIVAVFCSARSGSILLGGVTFRANGTIEFQNVTLPLTYSPNVAQFFEMTFDFAAETTSLSIDGSPVTGAQNLAFTQTATNLTRFSISTGGTSKQDFAFDDVKFEIFDCQ
jgi:hypothetical protein